MFDELITAPIQIQIMHLCMVIKKIIHHDENCVLKWWLV